MKKFRMMLVGVAALVLEVACAADGYSGREDHAVSDGDDAKDADKLEFDNGLLMSANPYCCGNHWGVANAAGQPADADTIGFMDGVGDDGARLDTEPAEKADGASSRSGADADASEGQLTDTFIDELIVDDAARLHKEPADNAGGASFSPGADADKSEGQLADVSGSEDQLEDSSSGPSFEPAENPGGASPRSTVDADEDEGQLADVSDSEDQLEDSSSGFSSEPPEHAGGASPRSTVDADEAEGQLADVSGSEDQLEDSSSRLSSEPPESAGGASPGSTADADEDEGRLAEASEPLDNAEGDEARLSADPSEDTAGVSSPSAADMDEEDSSAVVLESTLRHQKRCRKDASVRVVLTPGSHTGPALLEISETSARFFSGTTREQTIQLTTNTRVQAVSVTRFHVSSSEGSWTLIADDRAQRDVWINALVHANKGTDHAVMFGEEVDMVSDGDSVAAPASNPTDILDFRTSARGMQPRRVTLAGPTLTACKVTAGGRATRSCQDLTLDRFSDAVRVSERKEPDRALFRVTTDSFSKSSTSWIFDDGSSDEQARWVELIKGAVLEVKEDGGIDAETVEHPSDSESFDSRYRGWQLGPNDPPLLPGMFLARAYKSPFSLEVTEIGDILISPGHKPDRIQEPLWAHRATGSFGGVANGGLVCVLETFFQRVIMSEEEPQTELSVKNGRWRVGRGRFCTLGQSPTPRGSFRRFLPWDERGSAIRGASLELYEDGTALIVDSEKRVLWDSYRG